MVLKKGRFGQFFACTGYPDCKTTKPVGSPEKKADVPLDEKCPQCGHENGYESDLYRWLRRRKERKEQRRSQRPDKA